MLTETELKRLDEIEAHYAGRLDSIDVPWLASKVRALSAQAEPIHLDIGTGALCNTAGKSTDDHSKVTCPDCLRVWGSGMADLVGRLSAQIERLERVLAAEPGSHLIRVTDSGEIGMNSGQKRHRVECLTCGVVLHESTTGPVVWIKRHIEGARCPYEQPMTAAEQALRGGE